MHTPRILVADQGGTSLDSLVDDLAKGEGRSLDLSVTRSRFEGVLDGDGDYDAIVCAIERDDELDVLAKVKKTGRRAPILVLVPSDNSALAGRARAAGMDFVLRQDRNPRNNSELIKTAIQTCILAVRSAALTSQAKSKVTELDLILQEQQKILERSRGNARPAPPGGASVMVVEDDASGAFLLQRLLEKSGFRCTHVTGCVDGAVAYMTGAGKFADRERFPLPHLVFLDLHLPKKSGFELLQWIKTREETRHVVVIVNADSENPADIRRAYALGANSHLVQPPTPEDLKEMVAAMRIFWGSLSRQTKP